MFDGIDGADGGFGLERQERVHLLPEADRISQLALGDEAQPLMLLAQNEGTTLFLHAFAITFEQSAADVFAFEGKTSGLDGEMGADGETHQIDGVGHGPGFVEVVDSPDEAAFDVTPGAEVFDMKIADGENVRRLGEIRADLRPELRPAVVGGAKEGKSSAFMRACFRRRSFLSR